MCSRCFTLIGKGIPHPGVKAQKVANLSGIVKNTSGNSRSKVTASTLKTIAEEEGVSTRGGVLELASSSKHLPIQIGNPQVKSTHGQFSHKNLKQLQTVNNLSDKTLL